jgi:hypothetical protein
MWLSDGHRNVVIPSLSITKSVQTRMFIPPCSQLFTLCHIVYISLHPAPYLLGIFILKPLVDYFRDPKGLRKYPNLSPLAGITNLAFIWESNKGFRSAALLEAHKKSPVVRIGPNSLSYGDPKAIKVCSVPAILDFV